MRQVRFKMHYLRLPPVSSSISEGERVHRGTSTGVYGIFVKNMKVTLPYPKGSTYPFVYPLFSSKTFGYPLLYPFTCPVTLGCTLRLRFPVTFGEGNRREA